MTIRKKISKGLGREYQVDSSTEFFIHRLIVSDIVVKKDYFKLI